MFHISHNKYLLGDLKLGLWVGTLRKKPCFLFYKFKGHSLRFIMFCLKGKGWRQSVSVICCCSIMGCFNIQLFMSWLFQFCTVSQGFQTHIPWLIHCLMYTLLVCGLLICWECSRENTSGFLPFVFASDITQFTYKYGLSCPFSMPESQTNLPLALIWKMSLLSQGNRIILIDGKRQNHICLDKKKAVVWEDGRLNTVWAECKKGRAFIVELWRSSCRKRSRRFWHVDEMDSHQGTLCTHFSPFCQFPKYT